MTTRTAATIRLIVPNLRGRWPDELAKFSDTAIALAYEDFSMSDDHGDNDAKFPDWFETIPTYE